MTDGKRTSDARPTACPHCDKGYIVETGAPCDMCQGTGRDTGEAQGVAGVFNEAFRNDMKRRESAPLENKPGGSPGKQGGSELLSSTPEKNATPIACVVCGAPAVWHYEPSGERDDRDFCDEHVSRGCSCNVDPNTGVEDVDEKGRLLPCVEYSLLDTPATDNASVTFRIGQRVRLVGDVAFEHRGATGFVVDQRGGEVRVQVLDKEPWTFSARNVEPVEVTSTDSSSVGKTCDSCGANWTDSAELRERDKLVAEVRRETIEACTRELRNFAGELLDDDDDELQSACAIEVGIQRLLRLKTETPKGGKA